MAVLDVVVELLVEELDDVLLGAVLEVVLGIERDLRCSVDIAPGAGACGADAVVPATPVV